eukprot:scaffold71475_cov67-Phaeocystis_antarctica.AAC.9
MCGACAVRVACEWHAHTAAAILSDGGIEASSAARNGVKARGCVTTRRSAGPLPGSSADAVVAASKRTTGFSMLVGEAIRLRAPS